MPTLKWKLKDPKSCEGCIFHSPKERFMEDTCKIEYEPNDSFSFDRPQACIDELDNNTKGREG